MRTALLVLIFAPLTMALGCGGQPEYEGPELIPVSGTVLLDEQPLPGANVLFTPIDSTPGQGGNGRTDETGKFELMSRHGLPGVPAGTYRVAVSRRLMPDGTPVPADDPTPPIESPASESLPAYYSSPEQSTLTTTVQAGGEPIELKLSSSGGGR